MGKEKRLGRGLSALIPTEEESKIKEIEIEKILPNPYQPRETIDIENLRELSESIKQRGVLQPILVRQKDDKYEIVAGERRYQSAKIAGLSKIPAIVLNISDQEAYEISLIENLQREDLNPIEKAKAFQNYIEKYNVTHEELANKLNISRTEITNLLRLLQLPLEIQEEVRRGNLTYGHARALLSIDDPNWQKILAQRIIKEKLSVRETEDLARRKGKKIEKIPEIMVLERKLQEYLETKVKIQPRSPEKGKITIEYRSLKELERIIEKFML
ncbi:MAG: ParB/RepB/Spo0J family partition protein [Dictyoglomus sp.]|nr:ParB/RepB/Spo0J family partition protein [Dictyoglomus sp.]MDW8188851.1 ParB/RepB/Spo0J family partition protein [Dictyoglomus sp.]